MMNLKEMVFGGNMFLKVFATVFIFVGITYGLRDCTFNHVTHRAGSSFASTDGCNTCSCNNGIVSCTAMFCLPKGLPCKYGNTTYNEGANFKSLDGCNTCGCNNGMVMCTLMACI